MRRSAPWWTWHARRRMPITNSPPAAWCRTRPSWPAASVAPLKEQVVNLGVSELSFAMFGRDPAEFPIPQPFFNPVQRRTEFEKIGGVQALGGLDDFGNG